MANPYSCLISLASPWSKTWAERKYIFKHLLTGSLWTKHLVKFYKGIETCSIEPTLSFKIDTAFAFGTANNTLFIVTCTSVHGVCSSFENGIMTCKKKKGCM